MPRSRSDNPKIGDLSTEVHKKIVRFAKKMLQRYGSKNYNTDELIKKSRKHIGAHNISNQEFEIYVNYLNNLIAGRATLTKKNALADILGAPSTSRIVTGDMKFSSSDRPVIDKIIELVDNNRTSYTNCVVQSVAYNSSDNIIYTPYEPGRDNSACSVPPIIAALFIGKIEAIDSRFIKSNLANIIKERVKGHAPRYKADLEFFMDLINDPNDLTCNEKTLYKDIHRRCEVQHILRDLVWKFRNGQVYNCDYNSLFASIDRCRASELSSSPHLLYVRDEGTLLKKLLEIFSFRPIKMIKKPLGGMYSVPATALALSSIKSQPLIEVRLPPVFGNTGATQTSGEIGLLSSIYQPQWTVAEGGKNMVMQVHDIVYCNDVLIFYVNRRYNSVQYQQDVTGFCNMPVTVDGSEVLNPHPIKYEETMHVAGSEYRLRSVVICNTQEIDKKEVIVGNSTIFISWPHKDQSVTAGDKQYYWYDPANAVNIRDSNNNIVPTSARRPITEIHAEESDTTRSAVVEAGFKELAQTRGTIYVYSKSEVQFNNC